MADLFVNVTAEDDYEDVTFSAAGATAPNLAIIRYDNAADGVDVVAGLKRARDHIIQRLGTIGL